MIMKTKKQILLEEILQEISNEEFNKKYMTLYRMKVSDLEEYLKKINESKESFYFELI